MPELNAGDTAWMLMATGLVLFMTPGLAFFYGGMVRGKNVLGMLMQNFFAMGLLGVLWAIVGFTIAFGNFGDGGFFGSFEFAGLKNVTGAVANLGADPGIVLPLTIPLILFAAYQMTFAIITPALITGSTADRMKFSAYAVFIAIWLVLVYAPVAHWVFGGGWLAKLGSFDFAGGAVVHINAGIAGLVLALLLGRRKGWPGTPMPPHSLPWTLIGTGILWFGWAGFNAGSALAANGIAAQAIFNTFIAASAAMLGWLVVERIKDGHPTTLGAASGAVAGLVAITPCAGFVDSMSAIIIGAFTGALCFLAIGLKHRLRYDDALDVVGVHLVGGLAGSILLGLFASSAINPAIPDGLLFGGGAELLKNQVIAAVAVLAFSGVMTLIIALAIDKTIGLRVSAEDEELGLDLSQHAESAYTV